MPRAKKSSLTAEELVLLAQQGDDKAMAMLVAQVTPIAAAKAASYKAKELRLFDEDLIQEGMLGFLDAVRTFSPEGGASFRTYADVCINNRIIAALRLHCNAKNYALSSAVGFENEESSNSACAGDPQDIVDTRADAALFEELVSSKAGLTELEKKVAHLKLAGCSYAQISASLGVSEKTVDNALQRVKKKLRAKL